MPSKAKKLRKKVFREAFVARWPRMAVEDLWRIDYTDTGIPVRVTVEELPRKKVKR